MLIALVVVLTTMNGYCPNNNFYVEHRIPDFKYLVIASIMMVESGGDLNSYNPDEDAHGILQIRKPVLNDVNRYYGRNYSVRDTYIFDTAVEIFWLYQQMWNTSSLESIARTWNGGPKGTSKASTLGYYKKVEAVFNRLMVEYSSKQIKQL